MKDLTNSYESTYCNVAASCTTYCKAELYTVNLHCKLHTTYLPHVAFCTLQAAFREAAPALKPIGLAA